MHQEQSNRPFRRLEVLVPRLERCESLPASAPGSVGVCSHLVDELGFALAVDVAEEAGKRAEVKHYEIGTEADEEDDNEKGAEAEDCVVDAPY